MSLKVAGIRIVLFMMLVGGLAAVLLTAVTAVVVLSGGILSWMVPSLPFASASVVAGLSLAVLVLLVRTISEFAFRLSSYHSEDESSDEEDDDSSHDDVDDEELARRTAELTVAMLTRRTPEQRYTSRSRRK